MARVRLIVPTHGRAEAAAAARVVRSGMLAAGPEVDALEHELASGLGTTHAIAVGSGTAALELTLRALGVGPGDEVVTTAFTFFATVSTILAVGAVPVLADVDPVTHNVSPDAVADAVTSRTAAIVGVHLYGRPCDMDAVAGIARRHKLAVVEDACQALGASLLGNAAGTMGTAGCFSFYGSKNLSCGEGGAVVTADPGLAARVRRLRSHGCRRVYEHRELGTNARMSDLHAAVLRVQLARLHDVTRARRAAARRYDALLGGLRTVTPPAPDASGASSAHHLYTLTVSRRRPALMTALDRAEIDSRVHYPRPVHRQPAWPLPRPRLAGAEHSARTVLSIPMHPHLRRSEIERVAAVIRAFDESA